MQSRPLPAVVADGTRHYHEEAASTTPSDSQGNVIDRLGRAMACKLADA